MALVGYESISFFFFLLVTKHLGVRFGVYSLACKRRSLLIAGLISLERFRFVVILEGVYLVLINGAM